jgi:hypothetical protein
VYCIHIRQLWFTKLYNTNHEARQFCELVSSWSAYWETEPKLIQFSSKTWSQICGHVNSQNNGFPITLYNKFWLFFLLRKQNMFPFIDFGTLNTKMVTKKLDCLQRGKKKKNIYIYLYILVIHASHTILLAQRVLTGLTWLNALPLRLLFVRKSRRIPCYRPAIVG